MTNYKNNLPLYAEQITINQEVEQIQEILSRFNQLKPSDNFIQAETDYIFTTKSKWSKPLSERYSFEYEGDWFQIDIPHTIMESIELEKGAEIPYPFYLDSKVLKRKPTCGGITINDKKEIFLQKPFTIQNLKQNLGNLFQQIEELEREKSSNKKIIKDLEKDKNDWKNEWLTEWRKNRTLTTERNNFQNQTIHLNNSLQTTQQARDQIQASLKSSLINSLFKNKRTRELNNCLSFLRSLLVNKNQEVTNLITQRNNLQTQLNQTQTERNNSQNQVNHLNQQLTDTNNLINNLQTLLGINDLNNLPELPAGETLTSLLARPTLTQLNDLRREKDQELTTKNTQITNLTNQVNTWNNYFLSFNGNPSLVKAEIDNLKNELEKEQKWWDKWFAADLLNYSNYSNKEICKEIIDNSGLLGDFEYRVRILNKYEDNKYYQKVVEEKWKGTKKEIIKAIYQYYRDR